MSEQAPHEFVDLIRDQWGPEHAGQLMELLPPAGARELATRDDLALTRVELRGEMAELRSDLRGEMSELRSDLRNDMSELRSDLRGEMAAMSTSIERRISDQGRSFIVATVTAYVGIAGVVFAAASFAR